jgi:hypothetical protein
MMTPSNGIGAISLREEQDEKQRLEKDNFDLKMKLFYLESNSKRNVTEFDGRQTFPSSTQSNSFLQQLDEV